MRTLKYLDARKDKLLYRRRVPAHLRSLYGKDFYYRQLNCPVGASDAEVVKAWTEAHKSFVVYSLKLWTDADFCSHYRGYIHLPLF